MTEDTVLKAIGYWHSEYEPMLPRPQVFVPADYTPQLRNRIIAYLRSGRPFDSWMGYSTCRFNCGFPDEEMGDSDLTDGIWLWPEGLWHYIDAHNVALPDDFLHTMQSRQWRVPLDQLPDFANYGPGSSKYGSDRSYWLSLAHKQIGSK